MLVQVLWQVPRERSHTYWTQLVGTPSGDTEAERSAEHVGRAGVQAPVAGSQVMPLTQSSLVAHFALQALSLAHSSESGHAAGALHAPLPSQSAILLPLQPAPQTVLPSGYAQAIADLLSQVPPQPLPSSAHAGRFSPCGLPEMVVQVPAAPATSQA